MQRLSHLVVLQNIRSILLDVSGSHNTLTAVVIPSLLKCGYKVGVLTDQLIDNSPSTFYSSQRQSFFEAAASHLNIPPSRSIVLEAKEGVYRVRFGNSNDILSTPPTSVESFVQELLGFEQALDSAWTHFGAYGIRKSEIFYESTSSLALVNLKPIVPGHVLVIPKRRMDRFLRLDSDEVSDLWQTAQFIATRMEKHYTAEAYTFSIQDGISAGQTVPHCHIHVLPRHAGDFKRNDDIYDHLDKNDQSRRQLNLDEDRTVRTLDDMAAEATILRELCA